MENDENIAICYSDASVFNTVTQKELYKLSDKLVAKSGNIDTALSDAICYSLTMMFRKSSAPNKIVFIRYDMELT